MTSMELNRKERVILEHLISASPDARQVMRAYALIWLDEGEPVDEIAQRWASPVRAFTTGLSESSSATTVNCTRALLMRRAVVVRAQLRGALIPYSKKSLTLTNFNS